MLFAQYIQLLHRHISQGMIQPDFTEDFLCHATDKIKKGDYSTSSYKRFFAGKTQGTGSEKRIIGDTIGPFAIKHLKINENEYKTRLSLLQAYLSEMIQKADAASHLVDLFKDEIPDISSDNVDELAKRLCELFFDIINQAINDESRKKNISTFSAKPIVQKSSLVNGITDSDYNRMKDIITQLCTQIEILKDFGAVLHYEEFISQMQDNTSLCNEKVRKFKEEYKRFSEIEKELYFFYVKYPDHWYEAVKPYTSRLDETSFVMRLVKKRRDNADITVVDENNSFGIYPEYDPNVDLYYAALVDLSRKLDEMNA